jgi:uncharacterized protein DUF3307
MPWVEVFAVFVVCHLVGDFLVQTDWQVRHKSGGLSAGGDSLRALGGHVVTYTLAFAPAFVWLADDLGLGAVLVAAAIAFPHLVQDDGRLLAAYVRRVKGADPHGGVLIMAVDQSFHVLALFVVALVAGS